MRILIVGGGVAGLTLAGLLRQRGITPLVLEQAPSYGRVGYVLSLWPVGSRVLKGLNLYETFRSRSQPIELYHPCNEEGKVLKPFDMRAFTAEYGQALSIWRADLMDLLQEGCQDVEIRFGTTLDTLQQEGKEVHVTFSDGETRTFDLVVGCDGLRSRTRELLFGKVPLTYHGWTGWAWWLEPGLCPPNTILEHWLAGRFLGIYPALGSLCCFCAIPSPPGAADPPEERVNKLREAFSGVGGVIPDVLKQLPAGDKIWHDDFYDIRLPQWTQGRVLLLGDAGAAILPTAGIGASMAMESAAVLNDELSRADADTVELALRLYVRRRRKRVDRVQSASRKLARLMLSRSRWWTAVRNQLVRWASVESFLGDIRRTLEEPC